MYILGISAFYHDSAACLLDNGVVVAAAQEERYSRLKHDARFPRNAIISCLDTADISLSDIDFVVFYEKPLLKFERLIETYLAFAPRGVRSFMVALPIWLRDKLFQKRKLAKHLAEFSFNKSYWEKKILFSEHHLSHAASAFFPSPFETAAILTMDGVGEWATTSLAIGHGNRIEIISEINFPHSLGLLYSAFTYYLGFKVNSGEYKVMGLAPYGKPIYAEKIKNHLVDIKPDGSFWLDMSYFDFATGLHMTNAKFNLLFDGPPRKPETDLGQREMDIAASIQLVTEEIVLSLARAIKQKTGLDNLCLAGGVALNCVANGRLVEEKIFSDIWIQPAAGDAGGALGAALASHHLMQGAERSVQIGIDSMNGSYLGPSFDEAEIISALQDCGAQFEIFPFEEMISLISDQLIAGKAVGWHQGRMEFGPRALGNRSILADPRRKEMQKNLNLKIKFRESFRPFAPSVLVEESDRWFSTQCESPYMLIVSKVIEEKCVKGLSVVSEGAQAGLRSLGVIRSDIPAVTHVDLTARVQTVSKRTNPVFHALLNNFFEKTGCPILVNTSFNIRGEPIVCSPADAFWCFMGCDLDVLVIGNCVCFKDGQNTELLHDYTSKFQLD